MTYELHLIIPFSQIITHVDVSCLSHVCVGVSAS